MKINRSQAAKLSGAIKRYNRIAEESGIGKINYKDIKELIYSEREFKRQLREIKGITPENAEEYVEKIRKSDERRALRRLNKMLKKAKVSEFLESDERAVIMGEIYNIKNINKLSPYLRAKKLQRIKKLASGDYEAKQAERYRDWYLKSIKQRYRHLPGYKDLIKRLESYKSPVSFYNAIKGDLNASDIWDIRYSEANMERFNKILEAWGVDFEEYGEEALYS
jgi:hypothetical protein